MVTKSRDKVGKKQAKTKVLKLKMNKETVKDLTGKQQKQVKGGGVGCTSTYRPTSAVQ